MSQETGLKSDKEKKWELVQVKAFTAWINGYLQDPIKDLLTDLKDGVRLNTFMEAATNRKLPKWSRKPAMRVHMLENVSICLDFVTRDLGVRLVGIGPGDVVDGSPKLTLGLLWSLFRKLRIESISEEGQSSEDGLLAWIRKMTEGYPNVKITNFKDSFNDGMAFSALIHKFNPDLINFDDIEPNNREQNLIHAFEIAESRLGIPKLLDAEDLLSGNPDERSVTLYTSLFFHAFIANEEFQKQKGNEKKITDKMVLLQDELEAKRLENESLLMKFKNLEEEQGKFQQSLKEKEHQLQSMEDKLKKLLDEIAFLNKRSEHELEMRSLLEDKIALLESLLEDAGISSSRRDEEHKKLKSELEEIRNKEQLLSAGLSVLDEEKNRLLTDSEEKARRLAEMENKRSKLLEELNALRDRINQEITRRKEKEAEVLRLRQEIEGLKKKQIVHTKARVGLDVLKHNLEAHLEDLYRWRELNESQFKEQVEEFDLNKTLNDLSSKPFEDQLTYLDNKLQEENKSLRRIIRLQDSSAQLKDVIFKSGWLIMKGKQDWKKRWFVLFANKINYYDDEVTDKIAGSIQLDNSCEVVRQKATKEDEAANNNKKVWPLKITVGDRKLFARAASKKERHAWFLAITSRIAYQSYLTAAEAGSLRPDARLLSLFCTEKCPSLVLDRKPLDSIAIQALVKGLVGRDEIEHVSIQNANLTSIQLEQLSSVFDKLVNVKHVNLSGNSLNSDAAAYIAKLFTGPITEVYLANNNLESAGVTALVQALKEKESLSILDLSSNNISDEGAKSYASLISEKVIVPTVQLGHNKIGNEGASALASMLSTNKSVTKIFLNNNAIKDTGAVALAQAIKSNSVLQEVDLSHNEIGLEGALALKDSLSNPELVVLSISGNKNIITGAEGASNLLNTSGYKLSQFAFSRA